MTSANSTVMTGGQSVVFIVCQPTSINSTSFGYAFACPNILQGDYSIRFSTLTNLYDANSNDIGKSPGQYYVNGTLGVPDTSSTISIPATPNIIYGLFSSSGTSTFALSTSFNARYFIGNIYEVIVYTGPIADSQRQQVEGYLANKWGKKANLPPTHPYYAPNSIPLNRAFYPTDIGGLQLWLDGADRSSMTFNSGNSVSSWNDKSGNGLNMSTASNFPTYTATGVQFNGATPNVLSNATGYTPTTALTCFVVYQSTLGNARQRYFKCAKNGNFNNWAGDTTYITAGTTSLSNYQTLTYSANTTYLISGVAYSASSISWATNGTESLSWTSTAVGTSYQGSTELTVGGASTVYFTGYVMEVLMYDAYFTENQRKQVESYLAWKWGVNTNLPTAHPGKLLPAFGSIFTPRSVPGISLWLDAFDASTVTGTTSVTNIADKSGNNVVLSSATGFSYPNNTFNGGNYPSFYNPISAQSGTGSDYTLGINSTFPQTAPFTLFFVAQYMAATDFPSYIMDLSGISTGDRQYVTGSQILTYFGLASTRVLASPCVVSMNWITGTSQVYVNGGFNYSGTYTPGSTKGIIIGNSYNKGYSWAGHFCEFVWYSGTLTTIQRQQIEGYLAWKWGLQRQLPTTHAYAKFSP